MDKEDIEFELRGPGAVFHDIHTVEASVWYKGDDLQVDEHINEIFPTFNREIGMYDVSEGELGTMEEISVEAMSRRLVKAGYLVR